MSHYQPDPMSARSLRTAAELGSYVTGVCFKHGPPSRIGIELEWLLEDPSDPARFPDPSALIGALGPHTPHTLDPVSPAQPLPNGGLVTVEPGGQIEISSAPAASLPALIAAVRADAAQLTELLGPAGYRLAPHAADPRREPRRLLRTPRYDAMADHFAEVGPAGAVMMCSTAATQVCVDLGTEAQAETRWQLAHQLGPILIAAFANSPRSATLSAVGPAGDVRAVSRRMASWWQLDPARTRPTAAASLAGYVDWAMDAPMLARCTPDGSVVRPAAPTSPRQQLDAGEDLSTADVDLHLSMLFPPVRPQGYLELRYLDAQPGEEWLAPLALIAAAFGSDDATQAALDATAATAGRWDTATEQGLADDGLRQSARALLAALDVPLSELGLDADTDRFVRTILHRRLMQAISPADDQLVGEQT